MNITVIPQDIFLDEVEQRMGLKNDAALAKRTLISTATISRIRAHKSAISASFLLRIHEASKISIPELRRIMGREVGFFDSKDQLLQITPAGSKKRSA